MGSAAGSSSESHELVKPVGWLLRRQREAKRDDVKHAKKLRRREVSQVAKLVYDDDVDGEIQKLPDLAIELIARYRLLNLPLKTLVEAVWRNRAYSSLLKEQIFMRLHLERSPVSAIIHPLGLDLAPRTMFCVDIRDVGDPELFNSSRITFNYAEILPVGTTPLGSSYGALLVIDRRNKNMPVLVCNPITRELVHLPPSPFPYDGPRVLRDIIFTGICALTSQNVIKVLMVELIRQRVTELYGTWWRVCSLGETDWTTLDIGGLDHFPPVLSSNSTIHARYHWISPDPTEEVLKYFDFEREIVSSLKVPYMLSSVHRDKVRVAVLESLLCLCDHSTDSEIRLWLMMSYGEAWSWQRSYVIRISHVFKDVSQCMITPLLTVGDTVFFVLKERLCRYNKVSGDISQVKFPGVPDYRWWMNFMPSNLPLSYWVKDKEKC